MHYDENKSSLRSLCGYFHFSDLAQKASLRLISQCLNLCGKCSYSVFLSFANFDYRDKTFLTRQS